MTAISLSTTSRPGPGTIRRIAAIALAVAAVALYVVFQGQWTLPHDESFPLFESLNGLKATVDANRTILEPFRAVISGIVAFFDLVLASLGWTGVIAAVGGLGFVFGGWRLALLAISGMASLGVLGLWNPSMATLSLMLAAVILAILIGLPLGIIVGRSNRASAIITPILDVMQIMPTFAYLAPITLLFLIGPASSTIATLIYAIPAAIRITALGIRSVPETTVEASQALGSTRWQVLTKVQLPLARRVIGLAVNQTIMMALSMVVITGLIGAPGLGRNILQALQKVDVGAAFDPGLAIVILAIVLDRLTEHANEWMDPRTQRALTGLRRPRIALGIALAAVIAGAVIAPLFIDATTFPKEVHVSFREPVNAFVQWLTGTFSGITLGVRNGVTAVVLNPLETVLTTAPWVLVVAVTMLGAWYISGRRAAVTAGICLGAVILLGVWSHAMATLALVLVATAITLLLGVLVGVLTARSDRVRAIIRPFLDFAQTMPAFVYLIPAIALFGPSRFTGVVAAVIYAMPPVIRLVDAGIRAVSRTAVEAATAYGATERQVLWKVRLPMSKRALLLAANQGIVLVLAMVVIAGLVGAGALGYDVITGFAQGTDFGKGLAAGAAIVLLGILLDRITQGAGSRRRSALARAG